MNRLHPNFNYFLERERGEGLYEIGGDLNINSRRRKEY